MWFSQTLHAHTPSGKFPEWPTCVAPPTDNAYRFPGHESPSLSRDFSPMANDFYPSDWSDEAFREDTPPLECGQVHWVPDTFVYPALPDEGVDRRTLRHDWPSPSNESLSQSFNDTPDLASCSLSTRRTSLSRSISPHLSPTVSLHSQDGRNSPSTTDITKTSSLGFGDGNYRQQQQTLADFTNMNALAECAREDTISRFLQKEIRYASREDRQRALEQILPDVVSLSCDSHGNYVVQKFVEHGHPEHRAQICAAILNDIWEMSQHSFGCRVVQKVIEYGDVSSKIQILDHLIPHLDECIRNDNGNYVVQKLVAELPAHLLEPIYKVFRGGSRGYDFCTHPYGCRIVQRLLGHGSPEFTKTLCDEIVSHSSELARHPWGNYVIQYILESEKHSVVKRLTKLLMVDMMDLACDQLASNVMEKCLQKAGPSLISQFFNKFVSRNNEELVAFMNHQYGNFVVGTLLQKADNQQVHNKLYKRMKRFGLIQELRSDKYGRHVWGKLVEKLRRNF